MQVMGIDEIQNFYLQEDKSKELNEMTKFEKKTFQNYHFKVTIFKL